jgi:hypothetical protein
MVFAMINRVGEYENNTYDYNKLKTPQTSGGEEKFSLDYQGEDQVSSSKKGKDDDKTSEVSDTSVRMQKSGVTLELSNANAQSDTEKTAEGESPSTGGVGTFLIGLQNVFQKILQAMRDVFYKIWNDPQPAEVSAEKTENMDSSGIAAEKAESIGLPAQESEEVSEADKEEEIQKYLHSGDLDQVMNLLTDHGKKSVAKNSSLLTYYDRQGRLTEINPSDRERIMHGDRHVRKL